MNLMQELETRRKAERYGVKEFAGLFGISRDAYYKFLNGDRHLSDRFRANVLARYPDLSDAVLSSIISRANSGTQQAVA